MTDLEKMIKAIEEFQDKKNQLKSLNSSIDEIDNHLIFMFHPKFKYFIDMALKDIDVTCGDNIHMVESEFYEIGDIYIVSDKELKRKWLEDNLIIPKHKVSVKYYGTSTNYYYYDENGCYISSYITTSTTSSKN